MGKTLRWLSVALLAVASVGCKQDEADGPVLASTGEVVAAEPVMESRDGAWSVRTSAGPDATSEAKTPAAGKARGGARYEHGAVASAAPAPMATEAAAPGLMPAGAPMRAGSTDDNAAFEEFLSFLATWSDRPGMTGAYQPLQVKPRHFVRVLSATGAPIPAAHVTIRDDDGEQVLWMGTTYGDGRVPYYPRIDSATAREREAPSRVRVEVKDGDEHRSVGWDLNAPEITVRLGGAAARDQAVKLDVLFIIDTTGSMGDEIDRVKGTLLRVTERLRALETDFDLRYGAVLYKDLGDEYLTKSHPFTGDIKAFDAELQSVSAGGGGDTPESMNQAMAEAVRMQWRDGAAKVAFLIADAPPHMDYQGDVLYGRSLVSALSKGVRVHAVAASGLDPVGTLVFRQVAQLTRGKFIFIEYGSPAASAASHGVEGPVKSNNLDDIVYEQIHDEVTGWGKARPRSSAEHVESP